MEFHDISNYVSYYMFYSTPVIWKSKHTWRQLEFTFAYKYESDHILYTGSEILNVICWRKKKSPFILSLPCYRNIDIRVWNTSVREYLRFILQTSFVSLSSISLNAVSSVAPYLWCACSVGFVTTFPDPEVAMPSDVGTALHSGCRLFSGIWKSGLYAT